MPEAHFGIALDENTHRMFTAIRDALAQDGVDPFDRAPFLMHRSVVELVHGGRPTGDVGEAIDEYVALIHLLYLFWLEGNEIVEIPGSTIEAVLETKEPPAGPPARPSAYFAIPPGRRIWGSPTEAGPEPLDGWYAARWGDRLMVAAQFGGRPDRDGASIVAVDGPEPTGLAREDGTALFSPTLPGGARAGLYSLTGMEELLALAWRVEHWRAGRA